MNKQLRSQMMADYAALDNANAAPSHYDCPHLQRRLYFLTQTFADEEFFVLSSDNGGQLLRMWIRLLSDENGRRAHQDSDFEELKEQKGLVRVIADAMSKLGKRTPNKVQRDTAVKDEKKES